MWRTERQEPVRIMNGLEGLEVAQVPLTFKILMNFQNVLQTSKATTDSPNPQWKLSSSEHR